LQLPLPFPFAVIFVVTGIGIIVHRVIRKRKEEPEKRALAKDIGFGEPHDRARPHEATNWHDKVAKHLECPKRL
jgi:hypothetical protein